MNIYTFILRIRLILVPSNIYRYSWLVYSFLILPWSSIEELWWDFDGGFEGKTVSNCPGYVKFETQKSGFWNTRILVFLFKCLPVH